MQKVKEQYQGYVENTYARYDLAIAEGKGTTCRDTENNEYIDFSSGIGVNALGFCHEGWVAAVTKQLNKVQHTSNLYYTLPGGELAELLCLGSGMKKVFFANSGAEANEGAIKAARKYSSDKYGAGRHEIVTLQNSFHGRTMATLSATGQEVFHRHFDPFVQGFSYAPANDLAALKEMITPATCAVMIELVQGEGGVLPLEKQYVKELWQLCRENDILLIVDEVQTGMGRTGSLFCYQQYGIMPDIVTAAKGLGAGLPLGAVLFGEKVEGTLKPGDHATTFGGNPAVCAGGCYVVRHLLDGDFLQQVQQKGEYISSKLLELPQVESIDGMGLMLGINLAGLDARAAAEECLNHGLIVLTAKTKVRLLPPLNITYDEIDRGLATLAAALGSLSAKTEEGSAL